MCEEVFADLLVPMWNDGRRCDKLDRDVRCSAVDATQLGISRIATEVLYRRRPTVNLAKSTHG
jgi:hypothetical protein